MAAYEFWAGAPLRWLLVLLWRGLAVAETVVGGQALGGTPQARGAEQSACACRLLAAVAWTLATAGKWCCHSV